MVGDFSNSVGENYADTQCNKLLEISLKITDDESRLDFFRNLQSRGLTTRDIFSFGMKQADIRTIHKDVDMSTSRNAMAAKIKDLKAVLHRDRLLLGHIKKKHLSEQLGNNKHKMKKILKSIRHKTKARHQANDKKYLKKNEHSG